MMSQVPIEQLQVVADDLTGATDVADALAGTGRTSVVSVGCEPSAAVTRAWSECDARIVALKTRSTSVEFAVRESLRALSLLEAREDTRVIFKICSTFDSTRFGNIGPVADALLEETGVELGIVCPAAPANGRTVFMGHLFVGDRLLQESSMASHPLTPMRDSDIVRVLEEQSRYRVGLIPLSTVSQGHAAIREAQNRLRKEGYRYAVVDAVTAEDLREVATAAASVRLWVSSSGLLGAMPRVSTQSWDRAEPDLHGRGVVIAGSCSAATRIQLEHVSQVAPSVEVDATRLGESGYLDALCDRVLGYLRGSRVVAVSTCRSASALVDSPGRISQRVADEVEGALARVAQTVVAAGVRRLVVAGGETSGAVLAGLGIRGLAIGRTITTGVPWTMTIDPPGLWLALKSGNFGKPNFFLEAMGFGRV